MEIKNLFTPEAQQVWSQIAWVVRRAVKPLEKPIQDLWEQFTAKIQPAIQWIQETVNTGFVEPVMKPIERQWKITKVNKFLSDKGITVDDIKNLAEVDWSDPEEALQFFRDNGIQIQWMEELQAQQPTQVQPIQQEWLADQFKMKSSEEFWVVENIKDFGKFLINAPADSVEALWQFYDAVTSPIETVKWMLKTWQGISDKAVFSIANSISSALGWSTVWPTENAQMVDEMYSYLKDTYWTAGKFKKAIVENPVDTLLTLMGWLWLVKKVAQAKNLTNVASNIDKIQNVINPVNILKKEAQIVTAVPKYIATKTIPEILWKTTWTSAETIRTAFRQGGTPEFQSALRWETTPQIILSNVQEWMQAIKNNRKIAYWEDYAKLQANKTILAIDDVVQNFVKSLQDEYKIWVGKKWLDFSQSKITWSTSQSQIENMYRDLVWWKDKTPEWLDVLKQRLQDYYRGTPESSKWDRLSTIASNAVKNKIVENVPEYAKMTETYEKLTNDIRDITKTLSLGDKTQAQTAITKLMSVLRDNFPARQDMIKIIEQYTGKNIQWQIAWSSLSPWLAKWLAWVITGGGIVFWQLANPAFWWWLAVASPRLIWEIANTIGIPIEKFKTAINNIKNANPSTTNTVNNLEWVPKKPVNWIPNTIKNVKQQGIKPKSTTTNVFGETIDKPSNKKGGFIKVPSLEINPEKAIKKYTNNSDKINKMLREWKTDSTITAVDEFIGKQPSYKWDVYRWLTVDEWKYDSILENIRKNWIKDKAYTSTTENYWDATTFARNGNWKKWIMFEIQSTNWKKIDKKYNAYNEEEILFPRNTQFKYVWEYKDAWRWLIIKLKEVQ